MKPISDMYLAAIYLAYGAKIDHIDRSNPQRLEFYFNGEIKEAYLLENGVISTFPFPSLDDIEIFFTNRVLLFPPTYAEAIRRIKAAIYAK